MSVWPCGQAKLLDQLRTYQIIATTPINNDSHTSVVDDEKKSEIDCGVAAGRAVALVC
jgi:hypothetical protein